MQARRQQLVAGVVLPVKGILPFRLFLRKNLLYARKQLILTERIPADMRRILAGMHPRRAIQPFRTAQQRVFLAAVDVKARRHLHRGVLLHQLTPPDHRRPRGRNDLRTDGRNLVFGNDEAIRAFRRALQQRCNPAKIRVKRADDPARQKFICARRTERHALRPDAQPCAVPLFFQRDGGRNFAPAHPNADWGFPLPLHLRHTAQKQAHGLIQQRAGQWNRLRVLPGHRLRKQQRMIQQRQVPFVDHLPVVGKRKPFAVGKVIAVCHALRKIPRVTDNVRPRAFSADFKFQLNALHVGALKHGIQADSASVRLFGGHARLFAQLNHPVDESFVFARLFFPPSLFVFLLSLPGLAFIFLPRHIFDHQRGDMLAGGSCAFKRGAGAAAHDLRIRLLIPRLIQVIPSAYPGRIAHAVRFIFRMNGYHASILHIVKRFLHRRRVAHQLINIFHSHQGACPPAFAFCFDYSTLAPQAKTRYNNPDFLF